MEARLQSSRLLSVSSRPGSSSAPIILRSVLVLLAASAASADERLVQVEAVLGKYCFECHDAETSEADVDLSTFSKKETFLEDRRIWLRASEMLESRAMPPEGHQQPTEPEREILRDWITSSLENVDWAAVRAPGRVPLARMTRDEIQFAVEDLFGVRVEFDQFLPADPEGLSGFANDRTSLVMTTKQLMRTIKAAEIVAEAVVDQTTDEPQVIHYEVEEGTNASWKKPVAKGPDGSRGWSFSSKLGNKYQAVSKTFDFAHTGRYRIRMRAHCKGPGRNAAAWIAVDSVNDASREVGLLVEGPELAVYEADVFITKGRHTIIFGYDFYGSLWLPQAPDRAQLKLGQSTFDPPPYDQTGLLPDGVTPADLHTEGIRVQKDRRDRVAELIRTINDGYFVAVLNNLMRQKFHYERGYLPVFLGGLGYDYLKTVVPAFKELSKITETEQSELERIWQSHEPDAYDDLRQIAKLQRQAWIDQEQDRKQHVGDLYVDWIELEFKSTGQDVPRDSSGIVDYLDQVLPRALRRPTAEADRQRFAALYSDERNAGADHRTALTRTLIAVLVSPEFLYRSDGPARALGVRRLDAHALASRLSSFLWSSLPDEELVRAASANVLVSNEEIDRQVDRMLDDERRSRFSALFTEQWLKLTDIGLNKEPDKELFRYFSWRLAEDMRKEVALTFDRLLREDRSILELLECDETYLNERLARLYGIDDVVGEDFRLVTLDDPRRGGLLGTAAVLTSTSLATRTSPVRRGQFVLETILGVDLPRPPADVPQLDEEAGQSRVLSLRESLARHRDDPKCAGCHSKIDPPGFALENFDWIGRWRESDPAGPVDSNAKLPDGKTLNGVRDLKTFLFAERRDQFTTALTNAMLKYALGRDLEYFDEDAIRKIVAEVRADGYRSRTLVKAIARSYPFCFREIKDTSIQ